MKYYGWALGFCLTSIVIVQFSPRSLLSFCSFASPDSRTVIQQISACYQMPRLGNSNITTQNIKTNRLRNCRDSVSLLPPSGHSCLVLLSVVLLHWCRFTPKNGLIFLEGCFFSLSMEWLLSPVLTNPAHLSCRSFDKWSFPWAASPPHPFPNPGVIPRGSHTTCVLPHIPVWLPQMCFSSAISRARCCISFISKLIFLLSVCLVKCLVLRVCLCSVLGINKFKDKWKYGVFC